ncbi:MAG: YigZ family protein [Spirochaetaceae bacterium]|nr:YigZ family protein [Spirochaetaceae bacterium]
MRILKERAQCEIEVKKSRFIAIAQPVQALSQIKDFVTETRANHPGANHVVHAAVIGPKGDLYSYSDDHEPKNTAGRPALEVLKGSAVTNILILIVRYFGGTLLGTGGLVKAYGDSAKELLSIIKTEELIEKTRFSFTIPYNLYELVKIDLNLLEADIEHEEFTTDVTISGTLPKTNAEHIFSRIRERSGGQCSVSFTDL